MSGPSAPDPQPVPSAQETAAAQSAANVDTAIANALLNNVTRRGPGGSVQFNQTGTQTIQTESGNREIPIFEQLTQLDPTQQQTFDTQQDLALQLANTARQQAGFLPQDRFNLDGIPNAPSDRDFIAQRDEVTDATFQRSLDLLNPQIEDQERALQQQISNRGLPITGEDATRQLDRFDDSRNRALDNAALSAVLAGSQEQNRLFNLQQNARNQAISDRLLERNQPINELAAALQGSPAISGPSAPPVVASGVAPTDIVGAQALQSQIQGNNAVLASQGGASPAFGLLGGLGSAALLGQGGFGSLFG